MARVAQDKIGDGSSGGVGPGSGAGGGDAQDSSSSPLNDQSGQQVWIWVCDWFPGKKKGGRKRTSKNERRDGASVVVQSAIGGTKLV